MINYVSGILADIDESQIIVEAGGIGYGIFLPTSALSELPQRGTEVKIYTYFSVSEDAETLYGFLCKDDREMFKRLIRVNGVGPKAALSILGILSPDELRMAVATGDARSLSRAQGIGLKTAERVILDLKDKIGLPGGDYSGIYTAGAQAKGSARTQSPAAEAVEALVMLGYSRIEAGKAVGGVQAVPGTSTESILREALKNIRIS